MANKFSKRLLGFRKSVLTPAPLLLLVLLLNIVLPTLTLAQGVDASSLIDNAANALTGDGNGGAATTFDDTEVRRAICDLYALIQGSYGALLVTAAGISAIIASAFGAYRSGITLIVVALGGFILPSLVSLWFGQVDCPSGSGQFDSSQLDLAVCKLLQLIEGSFGALIMTVAGVVAVMSAAFGMYRAGYTILVTGVGAFILRSLLSLYYGSFDCAAIQTNNTNNVANALGINLGQIGNFIDNNLSGNGAGFNVGGFNTGGTVCPSGLIMGTDFAGQPICVNP